MGRGEGLGRQGAGVMWAGVGEVDTGGAISQVSLPIDYPSPRHFRCD